MSGGFWVVRFLGLVFIFRILEIIGGYEGLVGFIFRMVLWGRVGSRRFREVLKLLGGRRSSLVTFGGLGSVRFGESESGVSEFF